MLYFVKIVSTLLAERVFERAENLNCILFFDEADAIFGKRTSVSDSHDRYANQEVSYLLQRIEDYDGLVILSSNFKSNLDDAFLRRFQSLVHFPMPNAEERQRLWQQTFPDNIEFEADVDIAAVAREYRISGGAILNVVRFALLMTLSEKRKFVSKNALLNGLRREFEKEGKSL